MIHATQPFLYGEAAMSPSQRDAFVKGIDNFRSAAWLHDTIRA
jgi:hypothetical protein